MHAAIESIDTAVWDTLANPDPATLNPFITHAFLLALERSGAVGRRTGWSP
ncbi:MAG: peptidogalycan biosysnthesis protein, partial [Hyphomicrobiaceae bacterium]